MGYVSYTTRQRILQRDGHRCHWCGITPIGCQCHDVFCHRGNHVRWDIDHVMPADLGGSDDDSNLVVSCRECNRRKSCRHPDVWRQVMTDGT